MGHGKVGVIGGSGLYAMAALENVREVEVTTPFGRPSDACIVGTLHGRDMVFLPRHGRGHRLPPSAINFRANIYGLKALGVEWVIAVSAVGSMREEIHPGHLVIPDQFIDRTRSRVSTFFEDITVHVTFADPVCAVVANALQQAAAATGATVHFGGTYLCMEGPQFSTRAESRLYRQWGVDVIGMTNMPEAKLAREAELCYATLALATDYDVWHDAHDAVTVEAVIQNLLQNVETAKRVLSGLIPAVTPPRTCACPSLLANAVITSPAAFPLATRRRLDLLLGKYFPVDLRKGRRRG